MKWAYWSTCAAVVSVRRIEALICRVWLTSSRGIVVLLVGGLSKLLACDHLCCGLSDIPGTSGAKPGGKVGRTACIKGGDHVLDGCPGEQRKTGRSHVHRSLGVVERIEFVRPAFGEQKRKLRYIRSVAQFG